MNTHIILILTTILAAALLCIIIKRLLLPKKRHQWYIRQAKEIYRRINTGTSEYTDAQLIRYLRKINPYVFEELLLYAFERRGFKVIHNRYYSGDGGIDGHVIIDGKRIPIQAKRYSSYIKPKHIGLFTLVVNMCKAPYGFFIHTGRTGKAGYDPSYDKVRIISGNKLIQLLTHPDCPQWLAKYKPS